MTVKLFHKICHNVIDYWLSSILTEITKYIKCIKTHLIHFILNEIKSANEFWNRYRHFSENKQFIKIVKSVEFKKNMVDKYNFFITNIHGVEYYRDIIISL